MEKWKIVRFLRLTLCTVVWSLTGAAGIFEFSFIRFYIRGKAALETAEAGAELSLGEMTAAAGAFAVLTAPVLLTLLSGAVIFTMYCVRKGRRERGDVASGHKQR